MGWAVFPPSTPVNPATAGGRAPGHGAAGSSLLDGGWRTPTPAPLSYGTRRHARLGKPPVAFRRTAIMSMEERNLAGYARADPAK